MMHHIEYASVQPRRFTIAKRVIQIEAAFHPFEKREPFEVTDRNTVLVNHRGVIRTERQPLLRRETDDEELDAAAQLYAINVFRIAMRETVKLAITNSRCIARHVERLLAFLAR